MARAYVGCWLEQRVLAFSNRHLVGGETLGPSSGCILSFRNFFLVFKPSNGPGKGWTKSFMLRTYMF